MPAQGSFAGDYDVAVAGASFAGLATALAASQSAARRVLLDHRPVGAGQTSACGTTMAALKALGATSTVQQVHDDLVLHLAPRGGTERVLVYPLPYRFATFDYRALCRLLAARAAARGVEIVQARAIGWQDGALQTDRGAVHARCVVDATGWRATVASTIDPTLVRRDQLSCGVEAELPQPANNLARGLHFWAGQGTVWPGYAWSFPAGPVARLGVIAYASESASSVGSDGGRTGTTPGVAPSAQLRIALDDFLDGPGAAFWSPDGGASWTRGARRPTQGRHLHGGFLPAAPRRPLTGQVFLVGDAAGHCFGLTGEGIRPALAFATRCGQLLAAVAARRLTPAQARLAYARYVALRTPYLHLMRALQYLVSHMSDRGLARYSLWAHPGPMFRFLMGQYLWPANPAPLLAH